jgi:hypothetical protein
MSKLIKNTSALTTPRRVILILSGKGGVGKTWTSSALADRLRNTLGRRIALYDADGDMGGLTRMHGKRDADGYLIQSATESVMCYRLNNDPERKMLITSLAEGHDVALHDLPGNPIPHMAQIVGAYEQDISEILDAHEAQGARLTFGHVIDNEIESTQSLGDVCDLVQDRADHIAFVNMRECKNLDPQDFPYYMGKNGRYGKARAKFKELGGVEVIVPSMHPGTRAVMKGEGLTFSQAVHSPALDLVQQIHVQRFVKQFGENLAPAAPLLGLS